MIRFSILIVLTLALCIFNSGCDSEPSTAEVNDPVVNNSPPAVNSPIIPTPEPEPEPSTPEISAEEQLNLGLMYFNGKGVPVDYKKAMKWIRLAAEQGDAEAQNILGVAYHDGKGVPQTYKEAVKWYRLAAEQGHAIAQGNLGIMYGRGRGVPQDYKEAYIWYSLANAGSGEDQKTFILARIESFKALLSPEQLAEAQEEATARFKQIEERQ
jgi:hypothetical protein